MGGKLGRSYSNRPSNIILPAAVNLSRQTIKSWKNAIEAASDPEDPSRVDLMAVYDSAMGDDHLESIIKTRILKVKHSKFKLVNAGDKENPDVTKLFAKKWFKDFLELSMKAKFFGATVLEFWDLTENLELKSCKLVPRENCNFIKGFFTKEIGDEKGVPFREGTYSNYYLQIGDNTDLGILKRACPAAISKKFAQGAWLELCEKYGIPPRYATTESYSSTRHQELANMLAQMVSSHYAVLQGTEKIEMLNGISGDPHKVFDALIQRLEMGMSKRILGHDSAAGSKDSKGTYGSLKLMQDVANDRHKSDKEDIMDIINDMLIPLLVNISPVYKVLEGYTFSWDDFKELSALDTIEAVVKLEGSGHKVDSEFISKKTGIPIVGRKDDSSGESIEKKKPNLKALNQILNAIYSPFNQGLNIQASSDNFRADFIKFARSIYYSKTSPKTPYFFSLKTAEHLSRVLGEEIKIKAKGLESAFHAHLKNNLFVFSAAKTFTQYQVLSDLLTDETGKRKPWQSFKDDALDVHKTYNIDYLKTEYITAGRSAKMASKWQRFESQKDLFDLQFQTSEDNKVRKSHSELNGIVKPVNDDFWNTYTPPLSWRCRCTIRQVAKGTPITDNSKFKDLKKPTEQFRFNPGKQKLIFSEKHPYIQLIKESINGELQAVQDYGLYTVNEIYARGKNIAPEIKEQTKDQTKDWWTKLSGESKNVNFKAKVGFDYHNVILNDKTFNDIVKSNKESKHRFAKELPNVLAKPNEVYLLQKDQGAIYRFIKYYEDRVLSVNVSITDDKFLVDSFYEVKEKAYTTERSGILMAK